MDTGASADEGTSGEVDLPSSAAGRDALLPNEPDTAGAAHEEEDFPGVGSVLDFGDAGAYTLEERLGRGGMGEVYRARQVGAKGFFQLVAIKRLRPGSRAWEQRSFVEEARVLSRLHHENIARIYAFHELKGSPYLVMEYIEGQTLHALLELARRKGYRFPEPVACEVMAEVADALNYAHNATDEAGQPLRIVHRDVSPSNILITETGRAVLVDFGVALSNVEGRTATRSGFIKGKAPYLSPEQVKHLPLDARSDLFSVGTILVEMLTGQAPFGWTADLLTLRRIVEVTPRSVASLLTHVSPPLRGICQKLLAPRPEQRFATGREVALTLRRHAGLYEGPPVVQAEVAKLKALPDGEPQPAPAEPPALREVKRARRLVTVVGALAFASIFVSWYVARRDLPAPSSPQPEGPTMSQTKSPEQPVAAATPKPKEADRATAPGGPAARRMPLSRGPLANSCWKALALAHVVAVAACHARVPTGMKAGDCDFTPAREVDGVPLPEVIPIHLISLNGKSCTGELSDGTWLDGPRLEPCPAESGDIIVQVYPASDTEPFLKHMLIDEGPYLYGKAFTYPLAREKIEEPMFPSVSRVPREYVGRVTALFTEMRLRDGRSVPICAVLVSNRAQSSKLRNPEGVPILDPKYHGTKITPAWEDVAVKMYWPR